MSISSDRIMSAYISGFTFCLIAGTMGGLFLLPLKYCRWKFENTWLMVTATMYLILPLAEVSTIIPLASDGHSVWQILGDGAGPKVIAVSFICGLFQGSAGIVFSTTILSIGVSMGYSVMVSAIIAMSTLIPLVFVHPEEVFRLNGMALVTGVILMVLGALMSGMAGKARDRLNGSRHIETQEDPGSSRLVDPSLGNGQSRPPGMPPWAVVLVSLWVGLCASAYYFLLEFGKEVTNIAQTRYGVPDYLANLVVLTPWILGMSTICFVYCVPRIIKAGTFIDYVRPRRGLWREYALAAGMGAGWYFNQMGFEPAGIRLMGPLGVSIGASTSTAAAIIAANLAGIKTGEWKGVSPRTRRLVYTSVIILVLGILVVGIGNYLGTHE